MEEHILSKYNKCRKRTDESAFPYRMNTCDKCTDATRQYNRNKKSIDSQEKAHVQNVVQLYLGCEWNLISIVHIVSIIL